MREVLRWEDGTERELMKVESCPATVMQATRGRKVIAPTHY
jgi:hypothetical protein